MNEKSVTKKHYDHIVYVLKYGERKKYKTTLYSCTFECAAMYYSVLQWCMNYIL